MGLINYQVCSRCVMDTSDPGISFSKDGVCDHCNDFLDHVKPNWDTGYVGEKSLNRMLSRIKKSGKEKEFDCILGISGGVDSSYMLHMAVKEFGLRPLVFHVDGGWNSELAVHNINVLIEKLGVELYTEVINWEEMKDFQLAFFKSGVPHVDIPQDHAFIAVLYKFARKHKIKYILNGGNYSTECVQYPLKYYYYGTDLRHINDIRNKYCTNNMDTYPFSSIFYHKVYLKYLHRVNVVKPLNYIPFIKEEVMSFLETEYGWKRYPQKHFESRFTKFFEGYWLPERFGFDPRRVQYSSLILTNQMKREDALNKLNKPAYNDNNIENEFMYIATKLGINSDELKRYFEMDKKYFWDYKNIHWVFNLGAKTMHSLGLERVKKRIQ